MASAHHAVSGELSMRDERRPGLDGPGRMVKSRGLDGKISYLTKIWGFAKGLLGKRDKALIKNSRAKILIK